MTLLNIEQQLLNLLLKSRAIRSCCPQKPLQILAQIGIRVRFDIPNHTACQYYFAARFLERLFIFFGVGASIISGSLINVSIKSNGPLSSSPRVPGRSLMPKRIRNTFSSRGVSVDKIFRV